MSQCDLPVHSPIFQLYVFRFSPFGLFPRLVKTLNLSILEHFRCAYRHNEKSDLHRSNLESWRAEQTQKQGQQSSNLNNASFGSDFGSDFGASRYRDRAKERRQKYGIDDEGPRPNKLKEKYLAAMEHAEIAEQRDQKPKKLDSSNIGSKMLQRMGWKEGLGLGKTNQGRTSIIEVSKFFWPFFLRSLERSVDFSRIISLPTSLLFYDLRENKFS